jgi:hypothetical protein
LLGIELQSEVITNQTIVVDSRIVARLPTQISQNNAALAASTCDTCCGKEAFANLKEGLIIESQGTMPQQESVGRKRCHEEHVAVYAVKQKIR